MCRTHTAHPTPWLLAVPYTVLDSCQSTESEARAKAVRLMDSYLRPMSHGKALLDWVHAIPHISNTCSSTHLSLEDQAPGKIRCMGKKTCSALSRLAHVCIVQIGQRRTLDSDHVHAFHGIHGAQAGIDGTVKQLALVPA